MHRRQFRNGRSLAMVAALSLLAAAASAAEPAGSFQPLFDGKTLGGWDGDPRFWKVENGEIVGQTTETNKAERNTFLICRAGEFGDFELRFRFQVKGQNSGVQYRSVDRGNWTMAGYQCDFEDRWQKSDAGPIDKYSGMFFDEGGRMFMGQRGDVVVVRENPADSKKPLIDKIASTGDPVELAGVIRRDDWNECRVIARGFDFVHIINGRVMAVGIDEDAKNRRASGLIGFQLHSGVPLQIRMKDIEIRKIDAK